MFSFLGWGRMENGASADYLQQAVLPPVSQETCRKKWKVEFLPHLCAGEARDGATGGCQGDSGGPLACEEGGRWVLHGVVSYGMKWCDVNYYTVFARVYSYIDWIKGHIGLGIHMATDEYAYFFDHYKVMGKVRGLGERGIFVLLEFCAPP